LREIAKMTRLSKEYSAAVGGKRLFTQPLVMMDYRVGKNALFSVHAKAF
ncbi:MAG: hypothetical protein RL386_68, partial [Bacteroidota bacterium]